MRKILRNFSGGLVVLLAMVLAGGAALLALALVPAPSAQPRPLVVLAAAALKQPLDAIAKDYHHATGRRVQITYGASQTLLTGLELARRGDLYIPADDSYLAGPREKGIVTLELPVAEMRPVLAVRKGNPRQITSLQDLLRPAVRLGQANPDAAAIGKVVRDALRRQGQWQSIAQHTRAFKGTVSDVVGDLRAGALDAGFIWDAMVGQSEDLEQVEIAELRGAQAMVALAVLAGSSQPQTAREFAEYMVTVGREEFRRAGYSVQTHAK